MDYLRKIIASGGTLQQCSLGHNNATSSCKSKTCVSLQTGVPETPGRRRVFSTADGQKLYVADNDFNNFTAIRTLFDDAGPCVAGSPHSILMLPVYITSDILDKLVMLARCRKPSGVFAVEETEAVLSKVAAPELLKMIEACIFLDARYLARECARRLAGLLEGKTVLEMRALLNRPLHPEFSKEMREEVNKISGFVLQG